MKKYTAYYVKLGKDLEIISFLKKVLKTLILKTTTLFWEVIALEFPDLYVLANFN
jgi:hypothetical protein